MQPSNRNRRGSAITELGPALFVLLILIFFPLMDVIGAACDYAMANMLHSAEVREVSCALPDDGKKETTAQNADKGTIQALRGFAGFCGLAESDVGTTQKITHAIAYLDANHTVLPVPSNAPQATLRKVSDVSVTTIVNFRPFLRIPFLPNVPGLSADLPFRITSTAAQEEKGLNG